MAFHKNAVLIGREDVVKCLVDAGIDFLCHNAINSVNNCQPDFLPMRSANMPPGATAALTAMSTVARAHRERVDALTRVSALMRANFEAVCMAEMSLYFTSMAASAFGMSPVSPFCVKTQTLRTDFVIV